ncbi:MAG: branched-chain amino acid transporter permease [Paucimonas sp.]|nr:branched-chain amino acid transporter permease [Paucimonas sp.]
MNATNSTVRFAPINLGRWIIWSFFALLLLAAPLIFNKGSSLSILSQMATFMIFALSYNMLLGQGGMLSFGHAVYSGLGAYFAIHAMNLASGGKIWLPVSLVPIVGGIAGMFFGIIFGYVTTKKAGTTFAMITLGIVELVFACSLMFPGFFGGEGGINTNRVMGAPVMGITFGPQIQVYYLIAAWLFVTTIAMFAFTQTPLGRLINAVRDNPERAEFIGYNTQYVRYLTLILSAFFAGIAGSLTAINFEIVTAENVSALRSGGVLVFSFIGGVGFFFGPIIGAVIGVFMTVLLSEFTKAWQLYLGVFFILIVMYAPFGVAGILMLNLRVAKYGYYHRIRASLAATCAAGLFAFAGLAAFIELLYHHTLESANGTQMNLFGMAADTARPGPWIAALVVIAVGGGLLLLAARRFRQRWGDVSADIETRIARGEA